MGKDRSRSCETNLLANLAFPWSALLQLLARRFLACPLKAIREHLHSRPGRCFACLTAK
jgi:hypothetical protein